MAQQLTFDLPARPALGRDAFFVAPSNALAVAQVGRWRDWPDGRMILCGPKGAGKTHLVHVFAAEAGARIISVRDLLALGADTLAETACLVLEDADLVAENPAAETALFHLYNLIAAANGTLLLTATTPPARWPIDLADLQSRLQSVSVVTLDPPDASLLAALLVKLFADRQIAIDPNLIPYLLDRIERSAAAAQKVVAALDKAALAQKRAVTRRLAAEVLEAVDLDKA